jgi:hypothetical protein
MLNEAGSFAMATKKIWSVYEVGASYEGPLTEVEASSERGALDSAVAVYGVPRRKLYAVPGALRKAPAGRRSHSTKKSASPAQLTSEAVVAQMIGRRVKSGWHGLVDGEIIQWEPFGAGGTDVLVKDVTSGHLSWYASHGLTPIDGKGPLPSRSEVRRIREAEMEGSMKKIGERWAKEPPPPRIRR